MMARTTTNEENGTACAETAICFACDSPENRKLIPESTYFDAPIGDYIDCSGNEALECQICGAVP